MNQIYNRKRSNSCPPNVGITFEKILENKEQIKESSSNKSNYKSRLLNISVISNSDDSRYTKKSFESNRIHNNKIDDIFNINNYQTDNIIPESSNISVNNLHNRDSYSQSSQLEQMLNRNIYMNNMEDMNTLTRSPFKNTLTKSPYKNTLTRTPYKNTTMTHYKKTSPTVIDNDIENSLDERDIINSVNITKETSNIKFNTDISISKQKLLYYLLLISGLYSNNKILDTMYPIIVNLFLITSIVYQFFEKFIVEINYSTIIYTLLVIFLFWLVRYHLMRSLFNCRDDHSSFIFEYKIISKHSEKYKDISFSNSIIKIFTIVGLLYLSIYALYTYLSVSLIPKKTTIFYVFYIVNRIGLFYFYLILTSVICYIYYMLKTIEFELKTLSKGIKDHNVREKEFLDIHQEISIKMSRICSKVNTIIIVLTFMIISRTSISLLLIYFRDTKTEILVIIANIIIFSIISNKIANINFISDNYLKIILQQSYFDLEAVEFLEYYLKHDPVYFKIMDFALTYKQLFSLIILIGNIALPPLFYFIIEKYSELATNQ